MAITDADPSLIVKLKSMGKWPLPCQVVFVLKLFTQIQQTEDEANQDCKRKNRLMICGNFAAWGEHSTTTTNLDAPLLRLMLSLANAQDTTWSSAFLNADIHDDDTVLVTPPPILVKMNIVKPNTVWHVKKAIYGLRETPRLWQGQRHQSLRELQFTYQDKPVLFSLSEFHLSFLSSFTFFERTLSFYLFHLCFFCSSFLSQVLLLSFKQISLTSPFQTRLLSFLVVWSFCCCFDYFCFIRCISVVCSFLLVFCLLFYFQTMNNCFPCNSGVFG